MDIARSIVAIRVGADNGRVARKIFLAELQAEGLRLFQGQTVICCIPWVKADNVMMGLYITSLCVFAVFAIG